MQLVAVYKKALKKIPSSLFSMYTDRINQNTRSIVSNCVYPDPIATRLFRCIFSTEKKEIRCYTWTWKLASLDILIRTKWHLLVLGKLSKYTGSSLNVYDTMAVLKNASLFKLLHWPEEVNRLLALIPNLLTSLQTFLRMKNRTQTNSWQH